MVVSFEPVAKYFPQCENWTYHTCANKIKKKKIKISVISDMLKVTNKNTLGVSGLEMMQKSKFLLYQVFPINRNIFMFNQYGLYPITFSFFL